jgi:hypothetical protein
MSQKKIFKPKNTTLSKAYKKLLNEYLAKIVWVENLMREISRDFPCTRGPDLSCADFPELDPCPVCKCAMAVRAKDNAG